jgi:hypothetical protein
MKKLILLTAIASALPISALAHHGSNSQFDNTKPVNVSGVVTKIRFVNPHAYVYFDVTDKDGNVANWHCEMRAASALKRSGWSAEMFKPGTTITVDGVASRKEATGCYINTIALGDAEAISRYDQFEENKGEIDTNRADKTPWGDPNIAGDWAAQQRIPGAAAAGGGRGAGGPGAGGPGAEGRGGERGGRPGGARGGRGGGIELTDAGTAALAALTKAAEESGAGTSGNTLDCKPRNFFSDWTFDQHTNLIVQEQDSITMKYGFMDTTRIIHMNMDKHPSSITPSFAGHSIGHWEDDVLVVDTIGFEEGLILRGPNIAGAKSDQYHTIERISVDNEKGELTIAYEATDPLYWKEGQKESGSNTVYLSDLPWEPYNCEDLTVQ